MGGVLSRVRLVDGQSVHIAAHQHSHAVLRALQHADHAGLADARLHLQTERAQLSRHEARRAALLEGEFRVLMQVAAARHQLGAQRLRLCQPIYRHADSLASLCVRSGQIIDESRGTPQGLVCRYGSGALSGQQALQLDLHAAIHHDLQARLAGALSGFFVDDAQLNPDRLGADGDSRLNRLWHVLRAAEDVYDVDWDLNLGEASEDGLLRRALRVGLTG